MLLDVTVGDMNFKLVISSAGAPPSKFSVDYISRNKENDDEKDAVVQLGNFSGSLYISKVQAMERNAIGNKQPGITNTACLDSTKLKPQKENVHSLNMYDVSYGTGFSSKSSENRKAIISQESFLRSSEVGNARPDTQRKKNNNMPEGIFGKSTSSNGFSFYEDKSMASSTESSASRSIVHANDVTEENSYQLKEMRSSVIRKQNSSSVRDAEHCDGENTKNGDSKGPIKSAEFGNVAIPNIEGNKNIKDNKKMRINLKRRTSVRRKKSNTTRMSYSSIIGPFRKPSFPPDESSHIKKLCTSAETCKSAMSHDSEASSYCFDSEGTEVDFLIKNLSKSNRLSRLSVNRLHTLCKSDKTKMKELYKVLNAIPEHASQKDTSGKSPLHWIAQNEQLFYRKQNGVKSFVNELIKVYPDAIVELDDDNQIPFIAAIVSWTEQAALPIPIGFVKVKSHSMIESGEYDSILVKATLTPFVEWAFQMLSTFIQTRDNNNDIYGVTFLDGNLDNWVIHSKKKICENFCSVHDVLKTVLSIEDDVIRCRILEMPLLQRNLLCTDLVSDWLVVMLRSSKMHSRVIDYFEMISNLTLQDVFHLKMKPNLSDKQEFILLREKMFRHISQLPGLLNSLTILDKPDISRACSTYTVQRVLDFLMVNNSLIGKKFFDLSMNILLIISYHMHLKLLQKDIYYEKKFSDIMLQNGATWPMIIWICIYLFVSNDLSSYFMKGSCIGFIKRYIKFWNLIEILSLLASLYTTIALLVRTHSSTLFIPSAIVAMTKGLQWLRFFSFLKGINMELTTCVLAISKIISNLRWFLLILGTMCLMFADMMLSLSDKELCADIDPETDSTTIGDYCSQDLSRGLVRAYAIITGDLELDDYRTTPLITSLWVLFTFFGVIILLNVLIAIVTDSYERSFVERYHLFGKIRLPLLARYDFAQSMAKHLLNNHNCMIRYFCWTFLVTAVIVFEISLLSVIQSMWVLYFNSEVIYVLLSILLGALANISLVVTVLDITEHNDLFADKFKSKWQQYIRKFIAKIVQTMIHGLLGIKNDALEYENSRVDGWINYLNYSTEKSVKTSEYRILSAIRDFESRLEKQGLLSKQ